MGVCQKGIVVASDEHHDLLCEYAAGAYKLRSFDNGLSPAVWRAMRALTAERGVRFESVFDAAHGRRYLMFLYADAAGRRACWDFLTGDRP